MRLVLADAEGGIAEVPEQVQVGKVATGVEGGLQLRDGGAPVPVDGVSGADQKLLQERVRGASSDEMWTSMVPSSRDAPLSAP